MKTLKTMTMLALVLTLAGCAGGTFSVGGGGRGGAVGVGVGGGTPWGGPDVSVGGATSVGGGAVGGEVRGW
jgi:hypothetical protein